MLQEPNVSQLYLYNLHELRFFWIFFVILKIIFNTFKKTRKKTDNLPIRIYINKLENTITFKTKTRYYLELVTPETMKLLGSTKSKITKDENGENLLHLEITEVVLGH